MPTRSTLQGGGVVLREKGVSTPAVGGGGGVQPGQVPPRTSVGKLDRIRGVVPRRKTFDDAIDLLRLGWKDKAGQELPVGAGPHMPSSSACGVGVRSKRERGGGGGR